MTPLLPVAATLALVSGAVASAPTEVALTAIETGQPEPILTDAWQAGEGSLGCFHTPLSLALLTETFAVYDAAEPRPVPQAPPCFDAAQIGADLASGSALAFLGARNIAPGVDRVVAVYPDGRAYVWQQPNDLAGKN
ncbi:DUF6446 family protein [Rhodobacter capsulatus]|uniref:DUF6446 family protein n=1 Tax=Rhodobacter capsulatus TaxID=1061 RepID=UPI0040296075